MSKKKKKSVNTNNNQQKNQAVVNEAEKVETVVEEKVEEVKENKTASKEAKNEVKEEVIETTEEVVEDSAEEPEKEEVKKTTKKETKKKEEKIETSDEEEKKEDKKSEKKEEEKKDKEEKAMTKKAKKPVSDKAVIASIVIGVVVIAFAIFGFYFYKSNMQAVATFDGGKVTTADYTAYYKTFAPMLSYYGYPESIIPEQIANKAGVDQIILQMAEKAGVTLSAEDKAKVDEIFNDKDKVSQFQQQGIDIGRLKQLYYNDYIISSYIEKLKKEANSDDVIAYVKKTYGDDANLNEYDTSHILFKTTDDNGSSLSEEKKNEIKAKAEEVLQRAKNGEDFAALAKEFSEDTGTKEEGGKYLAYDDDKTDKAYITAVKGMKEGEVVGLVESSYGYHIIKLNKITPNGRGNSDAEREEFVNQDINKLNETKNLQVNTKVLNSIVKSITGKDPSEATDEESTSTNGSTDGTGTSTEGTTDTTNGTDTTNTAQ